MLELEYILLDPKTSETLMKIKDDDRYVIYAKDKFRSVEDQDLEKCFIVSNVETIEYELHSHNHSIEYFRDLEKSESPEESWKEIEAHYDQFLVDDSVDPSSLVLQILNEATEEDQEDVTEIDIEEDEILEPEVELPSTEES